MHRWQTDRDAPAIFGRGGKRLAAILSEAVPIWMENKPRCIAVTTAALWEHAAALKAERVRSAHTHEPKRR